MRVVRVKLADGALVAHAADQNTIVEPKKMRNKPAIICAQSAETWV